MDWFKLSVGLPRDPKWKALSPRAKVTYIEWVCEVAEQETDGIYYATGRPSRAADELVTSGLAEMHPDGFYLPAFLKRNKSHAEMEAQREARRRAGSLGGSKRSSKRLADANDMSEAEVEVEVEVEVEKPSANAEGDNAKKPQPTPQMLHLAAKVSEHYDQGKLTPAGVQKLIGKHGLAAAGTALQYARESMDPGFVGIKGSVYAWVDRVAADIAAGKLTEEPA